MLTHVLTEEERAIVLGALRLIDSNSEIVLGLIDGFQNATEVVLK